MNLIINAHINLIIMIIIIANIHRGLTWYVPGSMLSDFNISHLIFKTILWDRYLYLSHVADEEMETEVKDLLRPYGW